MQCVSFLSLICHFFGAPSIFLGQAWADGKGKLATCRHRADSGGETVKNVRRHSLDRLHASMVKQKKSRRSRRGRRMAWCGVAAADADGQQGGQDSQLVVGDLSAWLDTSCLLETSDVRPAYIGAPAQDWRTDPGRAPPTAGSRAGGPRRAGGLRCVSMKCGVYAASLYPVGAMGAVGTGRSGDGRGIGRKDGRTEGEERGEMSLHTHPISL